MTKIIAVDLDNTLTEFCSFKEYAEYPPKHWMAVMLNLKANQEVIDYVNSLSTGNKIVIFTARDDIYEQVTKDWLDKHGVIYHQLIMKKPFYHLLIDDRTVTPEMLLGADGLTVQDFCDMADRWQQ